jgi:hypothetical protein
MSIAIKRIKMNLTLYPNAELKDYLDKMFRDDHCFTARGLQVDFDNYENRTVKKAKSPLYCNAHVIEYEPLNGSPYYILTCQINETYIQYRLSEALQGCIEAINTIIKILKVKEIR